MGQQSVEVFYNFVAIDKLLSRCEEILSDNEDS